MALEVESSKSDGADGVGAPHRVYLTTMDWEDKEVKSLIATLRARQTEQLHLEVVLGWDSPFEISVEGGKGVVHLTGFVQPGPAWPDEDDDEEDLMEGLLGDEEEEEEEEDDVRACLYVVWERREMVETCLFCFPPFSSTISSFRAFLDCPCGRSST